VSVGPFTINGVLVKVGEWVWVADVTGRLPDSSLMFRLLLTRIGSAPGQTIKGVRDGDDVETVLHPNTLCEDCYRGTWKVSA
jgi:hypothetical protein